MKSHDSLLNNETHISLGMSMVRFDSFEESSIDKLICTILKIHKFNWSNN